MKWLLVACLVACNSKKEPQPAPAPTPAPPPAIDAGVAAGGVDLDGMDRSVKPGDDFFKYANGAWLAKTEIPADRANFGTGAMLVEKTSQRVAELIQDAAKHAAPGSDAKRVGDYFATYMDEAAIEAKGLAPLQPTLDAIAAIHDRVGLSGWLGTTVRCDVDALNNTNFETPNVFGLWVAQDLDDPSRYSPFLLQGGLGLPDRDFYFDPSPKLADIRAKYEAHIAAMLTLAKIADPAAKAKSIVALETALAKAHVTRVVSEDVHQANNHWKRGDLDTKAPGIDWAAFLNAVGLKAATDFTIWQPQAVTGISAAVASQPIETWKSYLVFHTLEHYAPFLPKAFVDEAFAFHGTVLTGTPKLRDRWKRGVDLTSAALGEAVGRLYVEKYFPPAEKARAEAMVKQLIAAFAVRIDHLDWMAPATKARAKQKLAALRVGVGYPNTWRDYSKLEIVAGDAIGNAKRAELFELERNVHKLGQPVDRGEWAMTPQLVNAVNLPVMNALNFPAAILQPPYFDPARPTVMDYGATGATIGHEISHSFDDQGAMFDATGKLANWWTPEDLKHFQASGTKLADEFDHYHPFPDASVNGKLTLSENIADVAGLAVSYDAYRLSLGGKDAPVVDGFTGDQQFFISFAQSWRGKFREAAARRRLLTDGHAPPEYRADTVRNLDAWYAAFGITTGALALPPESRVKVW
jgi:predicted metalloendopeptidase